MASNNSFAKCPEGHDLPRRLEGGTACTPVHCAGDGTAAEAKAKGKREKHLVEGPLAKFTQRQALMTPVPKDLNAAESEAFVNAKKAELAPSAILELEYQLKFGTDEQRMKAAERILDATGHGKREGNFGSAAVIIVTGVDATKLPWKPSTQVVDSIVKDTKSNEKE